MIRIKFEGVSFGEAMGFEDKLRAKFMKKPWRNSLFFDSPMAGNGRRITDFFGKEAPRVVLEIDPDKVLDKTLCEILIALMDTIKLDVSIMRVSFVPHL